MANIALRWSGIFLIIGAALLGTAVIWISLNPVIKQRLTYGVSALLLLAAIFLLLSLPGMYARQADSAGWLGLIGFVLLQAGVVLFVMIATTPLFYPSIQEAPGENIFAFLLGIALTLGLFLTGIATIRAGVFPRGSGILLLTATAGFFFNFFVAEFLPPIAGQIGTALMGVLLSLSLAWIGISLA